MTEEHDTSSRGSAVAGLVQGLGGRAAPRQAKSGDGRDVALPFAVRDAQWRCRAL